MSNTGTSSVIDIHPTVSFLTDELIICTAGIPKPTVYLLPIVKGFH